MVNKNVLLHILTCLSLLLYRRQKSLKTCLSLLKCRIFFNFYLADFQQVINYFKKKIKKTSKKTCGLKNLIYLCVSNQSEQRLF